MVVEIKEMIEFADFNTKENNLYLVSREAPTPEEKEIIEDIPFMQGVLDFSMILGDRIFENREIKYEFLLIDSGYCDRATFETMLKQKLMPCGQQKLYDSHDNGYYWLGKCKEITVEHDHRFDLMRATIVFDCYPFMFTIANYFDDVWDSFDFDNGIAGFTKYKIDGKKEIILINTSSIKIGPEVEVTSDMKVTIDGQTYLYKGGISTSLSMELQPGINKITVEGDGTIRFRWHAEVMG
jgi:hypothetical protein